MNSRNRILFVACERYYAKNKFLFQNLLLFTQYHHYPIIFISLNKLILYSTYFKILMKSVHFPSIFDSIIQDDNSMRSKKWNRKIKKFLSHTKSSIYKNTIKLLLRNIAQETLWLSTNNTLRTVYKCWQYCSCVTIIERETSDNILIYI